MTNQIWVTSVLKNFNTTNQKLQIDEQTFNNDLVEIGKPINNVLGDYGFSEAHLRTLEKCETLIDSFF